MFIRTITLIALLTLPVSAFAAASAGDKSLGTFGRWQTFSSVQNNSPVCYMTLTENFGKAAKGAPKRGTAYLMITHRPGEGSTDVVSYTAGYNYKAGEEATVHIGKEDFSLFTQKDTAWARDASTDHAIAKAIRSNKSLTITGIPSAKKAKPVADTIDLTGADKAYAAINKACGLAKEAPKEVPKPAPKKAEKKVEKKVEKKTAPKTDHKTDKKASKPAKTTAKSTVKPSAKTADKSAKKPAPAKAVPPKKTDD